jgi:aspartate aminotransferase-like enzyme
MLRKSRLFTPGPTPLLPAAQMAMASADFHHRTAEFREIYKRTLADLKAFIGTKNDVLLLAASGTGAMEASVSNLTSPGDKVLVLTAGKFGERWVSLAKAFGCSVETVSAPYGETFDLDQLKTKLEGARIVYMQATETSTGARHDVQAIAKLVKATDALLVVDGITGLGTTHLDVDGWGVDVIIGGSQKAVMVPPGLAYLSVSEKGWERMVRAKQPRYYFDLYKERKSAANGESAYTPATSLIAALAAAMDFIRAMGKGDLAAGRVSLIDNAETISAMTREAVQALGLKLFAPTCPAAAVTAVLAPEGVDSGAIVKEFRERFASVIANGQGEMKGKLFRVAHLGYYDYLDTIGMVGALEHVLAKVQKPKHIEFGTGLKAAQLAYLRCTAELQEMAKA